MDRQVVADLIPSGKSVRSLIVQVGCDPLWTRDGDFAWTEFARAFELEIGRVRQAEERRPRKESETDEEVLARINRVTRYAIRQILDEKGEVIRTQLVTALLWSIIEHGMPAQLAQALVFHETHPKFGLGGLTQESVDRSQYTFVAELVLPDSPEVLNDVYRETNAIDAPWHPTAQVRSTSMGDIVVLLSPDGATCAAHQVLMAGFGEVQFI